MNRTALLAASALAWPVFARAQTLAFPAIPSGGLVLQNPTSATLAARDRSTGIGFAKGSVAGTATAITTSIGGSAGTGQLDVHSTWPDGSARWASVTLPAPGVAAGASTAVSLGATSTGGTAMAWPGSSDSVTLLGSTLAVGTALGSSTDQWLAGPFAIQRRADMPVAGDTTGAMHLVTDETRYADGSCIADVQVRRDIAKAVSFTGTSTQQAPLTPLSFSVTGTVCGMSISQTVTSQNQYQDWHFLVGADGINVQHDVAGLEAAGLLPPYDLAMGIATSAGSGYASDAAALASSTFGTPLAVNNVYQYMPGTGGRYDIGITTGGVAIWLRTQDDTARRFALAQADTDGAIPWNFWNASTGRWFDPVDFPNLWSEGDGGTDAMGYTDYFANARPPQDMTNSPPTQPFTLGPTHMPNLAYVPALLTGSRYYRDLQQSQAMGAGAGMFNWPPSRRAQGVSSGGGDIFLNNGEVRGAAWDYRETVEAWALASTGGTPAAHLTQILADNWTWWNNAANEPAWAAAQGDIKTFVPGRYTASIYPPWEQDYLATSVGMGALLGDPGASSGFSQLIGTRENGGVPQTGYDPANAIEAEWQYVNGTVAVTTWPALQASQKTQGWPRTPVQLDSYGDYDSLFRATMAMVLRINPSDTVAPAALAGLYGAISSSTSNISTVTYQGASNGGNLPQEALAIPAITASNAWTAQEASLSSGGTGSPSGTSSGTSSSSSSSASSTGTGTATANPLAGLSGSGMLPNGTCLTVLPAPGSPMTPCGVAQAVQDLLVAPVTSDPHTVGRFYIPSGGKATASGG